MNSPKTLEMVTPGRVTLCYRGLPADSPDCCLRRNCRLRLDKIECALADEFTRSKFLQYLHMVGNHEYEKFVNAYVLLNDYTGSNSREKLKILLRVKSLIAELPMIEHLERSWDILATHNDQLIQETQHALVEEFNSSFTAFVNFQINDRHF